jgi:hypothetical protein
MPKAAAEVRKYIEGLPEPRRSAIAAVRDVVARNLPAGYQEEVGFGMITYVVPLSVHPDTYNKKPLMYAALASQKGHMALYLCNACAPPKARRSGRRRGRSGRRRSAARKRYQTKIRPPCDNCPPRPKKAHARLVLLSHIVKLADSRRNPARRGRASGSKVVRSLVTL